MQHKKIPITPDTKIAALLNYYPDLEPVLIDIAPAFKKLKNPVLRKTIAKVATLRQVAQIGDIGLGALINQLRKASDIDSEYDESDKIAATSPEPPVWFDSNLIYKTLDARPILDAGEHPLSIVMKDLKAVPEGDIYELLTPFFPAPIIDMATGKNFTTWSKQEKPELFKTYFFMKGNKQ